MAMAAPLLTALLCNFILLLTLTLPIQSTAEESTAYDLIQDYGFPKGLLPKGVLGFELDNSTGKFSVSLNGSCSFSVEGSYQLKYQSTIRGHISKGKLQNLQGISVKILFFWVNIVEVDRIGDEVELSVGIASASFPMDNFEECPQCGCGLDCGGKKVSKIRSNPFVVDY